MKHGRGFTLLEVLIVLTITSMLFLVGYAGYREFIRRQLLANTVREFQADLTFARQKALSGEKPTGFCNDTDESLTGYEVIYASSSSYKIRAKCSSNAVNDYKTVNLSGVTVSNFAQILFKVLGGGTGQSGNITVTFTQTTTNNTKNVSITPSGVTQ